MVKHHKVRRDLNSEDINKVVVVQPQVFVRVETKERECWKPDQRLTSENDSRFNGQPSIPSNIPRL